MLLAIDAGNTRTKWAIFGSLGEIKLQDACLNSDLGTSRLLQAVKGVDSIIISNVAGEQHAALLTNLLSPCNLPARWIKSSARSCGVVNMYEKPEALGRDRWAAIIAAWQFVGNACVVVNAGTAITIDAIAADESSGAFIGGLILPGLNLMQQSLGLATALLPKAEFHDDSSSQPAQEIFAKCTTDAIYNGALQAATGAIEHMVTALNTRSGQPPHIVISGGNASLIADNLKSHVTNQVSIVDNLVLQGLYLIHTNEK